MMDREFPIRVIVAKVGLDGHDRGIKVIARALRDAGMEVLYLGMRLTSEAIAMAAQDEDVDVVGISVLSGAHMRLMPKLIDAFKAHGIADDVLLIVGGTIPEKDVAALQEMGVRGVFPVGTFTDSMVQFIRENVRRPQGSL
jgi:methylmalonyl-CoA mutase C-terminal domain/subunit